MKKAILCLIVSLNFLVACSLHKPLHVYLVGDSTMADRADTLVTPERGWGQSLPSFLDNKTMVHNCARGGKSTKSFLAGKYWDKVMKELGKGDVVVIQFGHNDGRENDSINFTDTEQFAQNLRLMIGQAKAVGAIPILCTPIARLYYTGDKIKNVHPQYPETAIEVAKLENIPLVDMTTLTMEWLDSIGKTEAQSCFVYKVAPGEYDRYPEGKTDHTHLRSKGAVAVARLFAKAVLEQDIRPLSKHVKSH